jgi:hypothetical protein
VAGTPSLAARGRRRWCGLQLRNKIWCLPRTLAIFQARVSVTRGTRTGHGVSSVGPRVRIHGVPKQHGKESTYSVPHPRSPMECLFIWWSLIQTWGTPAQPLRGIRDHDGRWGQRKAAQYFHLWVDSNGGWDCPSEKGGQGGFSVATMSELTTS